MIYGVQSDGVLRWHSHTGWANGDSTWDTPRTLDTGVDWNRYERIVAAPDGVMYGMLPNGRMHCYRHLDWKTGGPRFDGPVSVEGSWNNYLHVFISLSGTGTHIP